MSGFIVIAVLMAAIAAAVVAVPLLRERGSRRVGIVAALMVAGAAAGLYPLWSNWDWHAQSPATAGPDVLAMVTKLEQHMKDEPGDVTGWLMLGRSELALERLDEAILAYDHAVQLAPDNADAVLGLGEAKSLRAGGNITPEASQLFEHALQLAPANPKALLYAGFAAAGRGDKASARARWQILLALHPPPEIETMLNQRIAELGPAGPAASPVAGATAGPPAEATVDVTLAPALKARLKGEVPLFLFAREPGGQGPPLAAKRLTTAALGTRIKLSTADSMIPGRVLVGGRTVSITARVSFSGQPLPAAGDLYGEVSYDVGKDGSLALVIDHVAE